MAYTTRKTNVNEAYQRSGIEYDYTERKNTFGYILLGVLIAVAAVVFYMVAGAL